MVHRLRWRRKSVQKSSFLPSVRRVVITKLRKRYRDRIRRAVFWVEVQYVCSWLNTGKFNGS